jgi:DNA phosphorothioation-dependent restriction protein DptG
LRPAPGPGNGVKAPAYTALHARMVAALEGIEAEGGGEKAQRLRKVIEDWWSAQQVWNEHLSELFGVHHEINNALVGIRGNAQLIQRTAAAAHPGVRERLEVVIRESQRIQEAMGRIRDAKIALHGTDPASHAA